MSNSTLIIAAIVAVLAIVGLVLLLRKPTQRISLSDAPPPVAAKPAPKPARTEGHGIADAGAAAVLDMAGPVIGVDAHPDLPSDDLTRIKGLGPKAHSVLAGLGIRRFAQLAALDPAQAAEVDSRLGAFKGRIFRDRWIDQARYLEQDDTAGFEKEFGKLG